MDKLRGVSFQYQYLQSSEIISPVSFLRNYCYKIDFFPRSSNHQNSREIWLPSLRRLFALTSRDSSGLMIGKEP
ncbi:hypothetical protein EYC80_008312 [Monilinia laxa]|uniref:Uncharacterized protein n=1 Tax=Monilinia laxa TaxID=61186 RepID=A0A5N6JSR1_MONLA|nr:hypothetical protein EYC80_008312 [Monilinia laxa]